MSLVRTDVMDAWGAAARSAAGGVRALVQRMHGMWGVVHWRVARKASMVLCQRGLLCAELGKVLQSQGWMQVPGLRLVGVLGLEAWSAVHGLLPVNGIICKGRSMMRAWNGCKRRKWCWPSSAVAGPERGSAA